MKSSRLIHTAIALLLSLHTSSLHANTTLPQTAVLAAISENMEISISDETKIELASLYIPEEIKTEALEYVREVTLNKEFTFDYTTGKPNRYGNFYAYIADIKTHKTVQEMLLEKGLALVYIIDSGNEKLFAAENIARKNKAGIWTESKIYFRNTDLITKEYRELLNQFVIINGRVKNSYASKNNTYINFGDDWKTDFTIGIDSKLLKQFPHFKPEELSGKNITVRGWLEDYNGPFIRIYNVENI